MMEQLLSVSAMAVVLGTLIAMTAMGEGREPRAKVKYTWIVDGKEYDSRFAVIKAALDAKKSTVQKCSEVELAKVVK